jgi:DNA-binding MarR family transcriptional regulator
MAELAELLARASRRLRRHERHALAPYGLTFAQARALRVLVRNGPMRIGDLALALDIVPRSATSRVDDLERAGLVARAADPNDRRSVIISATSQGEGLISDLRAERRVGAESLFADLSPEDQAELLRILSLLTRGGCKKKKRGAEGSPHGGEGS